MIVSPRHPYSKRFFNQGLTANSRNFQELEAKIASLPTEQERGAAFEVFTEAWLATQRIPQAREVWPGTSPPPSIQESLRLPLKDMGVDGIVETATDELFCYQAKFRTGRPALAWRELSTFFGLTDSGSGRLVFTNCDDISSVAEQRPGALFVRGSDLDRLTDDDLRVIEAWISGASISRPRKSPLPHQSEAIDDILRGLARHSRATALMACGTGKTLVALWVAERLNVRSVLVLLPSLALVRQTLHEWLHETSWPELGYQYLCVCSDPTVQPEEDALVVRPSDVDFKVTTQSADVRRFLERPTDAVRLVFSTYQSSNEVAVGAAGLPPFDFGIFDEAHKTASRDGAKFALALKDERLPIARRLFLTATPRHYNVATKDKSGDAKVLFSMDVPDVYGPVVHRLPFSTAAKLKVITDYKIAITIVTSKMVTDESLRRGIVLVEGQEIKARQVANQIALQSAIKRYDVRKIFTFHSKVAAAASFTSDGPEGIATHLPEFHCGHINGGMATAQRERRMREFEAAPHAIMSNARCLTEGVDVPAVDMVAFLSPRRSLVDIVQATGRAMRRSPGKSVGYVLVPLYVEQARGETVEQAVIRTDFSEVWKVLNQLQEHDDLLAQTIAEMRMERGKTGGFDDSRFREKVELLPPELSVESLRKAISAACLEAIGDIWFEQYGQLVAYHQRNGTCEMPHRLAKNKKLATWVINQRVMRKDGTLTKDKIALLDTIGFNWSPKAHTWRSNYLSLIAYKEEHGDCRVPQDWTEDKRLAKWVSTQRVRRKRGQLDDERFQMLDRIGFEWFAGVGTWEERFGELQKFGQQYGHLRVPARWKESEKLAKWVVHQRYIRRKGRLRSDFEHRLSEIGFEWDLLPTPETTWGRWYDRLIAFKETYGHCNVSHGDRKHSSLAAWVTEQRRAARQGSLSPDAKSKLDTLGIIWLPKQKNDEFWSEMYDRLIEFKKRQGHVDVPQRWPDGKLARWVGTQRRYYRVGKLSQDRLDRLTSIGFRFPRREHGNRDRSSFEKDPHGKTWNDHFETLCDYFRKFGNCDVPEDWYLDGSLAAWVNKQRLARRVGRLSSEKLGRLNAPGFTWNVSERSWDEMFVNLEAYLDAQISTGMPSVEAGLALRRWMLAQRQALRNGTLAPERTKRLQEIGFEWQPHSDRWSRMFEKLRKFYAIHNHCRVPAQWKDDPQLAHWVAVQRARNRSGKMPDHRKSVLNEIGFEWRIGTGRGGSPNISWPIMLARLKAFKESHGNCNVPHKWHEDRRLASWVSHQRLSKNRGTLPPDRKCELEAIGIDWQPYENRWAYMLSSLQDFRSKHGTWDVPNDWKENPQLASWVDVQRQRKREGKLSDDRVRALEDCGFPWRISRPTAVQPRQSETERWHSMVEALRDYKEKFGNCLVPQKWPANPSLANWVTIQRRLYKQGTLDAEEASQLATLGFDFDPIDTKWDAMFDTLVEFKREHGHCNVSQRAHRHKQLAQWVRNQRAAAKHKRRSITPERVARLNELGFKWALIEPHPWEQMFAILEEFRKRYGHCNVPQKWTENRQLGKWVNTQRTHAKLGKIRTDRRERLDALGFAWDGRLLKGISPTAR